jgi:uncharacterized membrane protein YkvA (DUF1232 family)
MVAIRNASTRSVSHICSFVHEKDAQLYADDFNRNSVKSKQTALVAIVYPLLPLDKYDPTDAGILNSYIAF